MKKPAYRPYDLLVTREARPLYPAGSFVRVIIFDPVSERYQVEFETPEEYRTGDLALFAETALTWPARPPVSSR
jgi:hypothetical protein